jgi:hypothetical protein
MRNLIKNILKESKDEFDWIREVPGNVSFKDVEIGRTYRVETTELLNQAIKACGTAKISYKPTNVTVLDRDLDSRYRDVFCNHEREDRVISLYLSFHGPYSKTKDFWVTDDMVNLYPIR